MADSHEEDFSPEGILGLNQRRWGRWELDVASSKTLTFVGAPEYPALEYSIPLGDLKTVGGVFDWLRQLDEKTWCTEEDLGHFVRAALMILQNQHNLGI